jgi:hypothetical protein
MSTAATFFQIPLLSLGQQWFLKVQMVTYGYEGQTEEAAR